MGLSLAAMGVAAVGLLPPAAGALLQEGIDLAVILNALRALREDGRRDRHFDRQTDASLLRRFAVEHDELRDALALLLEPQIGSPRGPTRELLPTLRGSTALLDRPDPAARAGRGNRALPRARPDRSARRRQRR